ncbi:MAG: polymer-forming cytoskeletal protein [Deltaproteobacteria bacterium]|nr:polymer-forming cytoskeletal protein [Sandaracinaceae bacterium]MCX7808118.1 polymer-forming cytoskeletal protein [Deltaproteobacteria bacterium]MDW8246632.1 polymer-forming cytoskeletal protein [Sandaracinaceae bacterium]
MRFDTLCEAVMMANNENESECAQRDEGVILPGLVFDGRFEGKADLRIEGWMRGALALEGHVCVGPQAQFHGPISAESIAVHGEVIGDLVGKRIHLHAGAWVTGDVRSSEILIEEGATLEGVVEAGAFDRETSEAERGQSQ